MSRHAKVYFVVTIDTECDKRDDWSVRYPFQFSNILEGLPAHLNPLFDEFGVRPTYLLSPEVIRDEGCASYFKSLPNCELGTHLHSEYVEPDPDWTASHTARFQSDYPIDIERAKLKTLTDLYVQRFGKKPTSFRAGRFGIGSASLSILNTLGYTVDSSVFPLRSIQTFKHEIDFFSFPQSPYFPNLEAIHLAGEQRRLLEVPVTVRSALLDKLPYTWRRFVATGYAGAFLQKLFGRDVAKGVTLRPSSSSDKTLQRLVQRCLRRSSVEPIYLNMMFHSNEFMAGCSPYAADQQGVVRLADRVRCVLELLARVDVTHITLGEAYLERAELRSNGVGTIPHK